MAYQLSIEEIDDIPASTPVRAASIEPMPRPDYRAKKHSRPDRQRCAVRDRGLRVWTTLDDTYLA